MQKKLAEKAEKANNERAAKYDAARVGLNLIIDHWIPGVYYHNSSRENQGIWEVCYIFVNISNLPPKPAVKMLCL